MDADLWVRRVSTAFSEMARLAPAAVIGQPLFAVLGHLGVDAQAQDRIFSLATAGHACFVELPPDSAGWSGDHFAVEVRPIPRRAGWVIRYVAVAWSMDAVRAAQGTPAWVEPADATTTLRVAPVSRPFPRSRRAGGWQFDGGDSAHPTG